MPWHVAQSEQCPASKPWAVVKDSDGSVAGCHPTKSDAQDQMAALYAQENSASNPLAARARPRGRENRAYPVRLEVRTQASGAATLEGYASTTEAPYEMWDMFGPYTEVIRAGAFGKTLAEDPATQLLLNHGGLSMAYTRAGTLRLSEDTAGLHMAADVNTARSDVRDMLTAIEDGNVDEMSFAFRVLRQAWSPDYEQRDITEIDLHRGDVSVVNFGANPATSVSAAVRALDFDRLPADDAAALLARLQRRFPAAGEPPVRRPLSLYQAQAQALG